jgi:hypothetical protein
MGSDVAHGHSLGKKHSLAPRAHPRLPPATPPGSAPPNGGVIPPPWALGGHPSPIIPCDGRRQAGHESAGIPIWVKMCPERFYREHWPAAWVIGRKACGRRRCASLCTLRHPAAAAAAAAPTYISPFSIVLSGTMRCIRMVLLGCVLRLLPLLLPLPLSQLLTPSVPLLLTPPLLLFLLLPLPLVLLLRVLLIKDVQRAAGPANVPQDQLAIPIPAQQLVLTGYAPVGSPDIRLAGHQCVS